MVILHIYGAKTIFLLFCVHQYTESKNLEGEIGIARLIYINKKYQRIYGTMISILYKMDEKNIVVFLHIYAYMPYSE